MPFNRFSLNRDGNGSRWLNNEGCKTKKKKKIIKALPLCNFNNHLWQSRKSSDKMEVSRMAGADGRNAPGLMGCILHLRPPLPPTCAGRHCDDSLFPALPVLCFSHDRCLAFMGDDVRLRSIIHPGCAVSWVAPTPIALFVLVLSPRSKVPFSRSNSPAADQ